MRVLVACEFSGIVRDAFLKKGHDVMSCDILPSEKPGPHYQGDIFVCLDRLLNTFWQPDLLIAHPPCTYLCNSGVRWLWNGNKPNKNRWEKMEWAALDLKELKEMPIEKIAIENPIMHGYGKELSTFNPTQIIQPWQFGHPETKAICLDLKNLPSLKPTKIMNERKPRVHHMSPSADRWKERSRFYTGIAKAMAEQWG